MTWQFRHADGCGCSICSHRRRVTAIMRRDFRPSAQQTSTPAPAEKPDPGTETGPVPDDTVAKVLDWVDEDPATRVQAAYDHELAQSSPRVTMVAELEARGATSDAGSADA